MLPNYVYHFDLNNLMTSSTIESHDLVMYYCNGSSFQAKFYSGNGNILSNTNVNFIVNGRTYSRVTNSLGIASMTIYLLPG